MIYLFLNCDEFLAAQRLAAFKSALGDPEMADLNTTALAAGQTTAKELLGHAAMMPFLAPRRLVVVTGYLAALDKRIAQSKQETAPAYDEAAHLLLGLPHVEETCDLVFVDDSIDKRRALWKGFTRPESKSEGPKAEQRIPGLDALIAAKTITLQNDAAPDAKALPTWIQQRAKAKNIPIDQRAFQMLAAYVGSNLRQLDNELDKLAAYASGRAITADDILLLVSDARDAIIWDLTDALSARSPAKAMSTLQLLRRSDDNPFGLLALVARQYRIILKVKEAMLTTTDQPASSDAIAKRIGEKPYPVQKAMQQARAYTVEELVDILDRLLEADFAMKTGADNDTVVDLLVAELTRKPQNASRTPVAHALP